jgi:hypothetical protein
VLNAVKKAANGNAINVIPQMMNPYLLSKCLLESEKDGIALIIRSEKLSTTKTTPAIIRAAKTVITAGSAGGCIGNCSIDT